MFLEDLWDPPELEQSFEIADRAVPKKIRTIIFE